MIVYGLYLIECIQTALTTSDAFTWFVFGWGNPDSIEQLNFNWFDIPVLSGLISMTVQCFFAWRVWMLSKSIPLAGVIVVLSLLQGATAMAAGIKLKIIGSFSGVHELYLLSLIWLGGSAVTDIIIAISMTVLLLRSGSAVLSETRHMIRRLVRLTVETGTLTASVALITLIFQIPKRGSLYIAPAMILAKLYSNTFLAVINNRAFIRRGNGAISTPANIPSSIERRERDESTLGWKSRSDIIFSSNRTKADSSVDVPLKVYENNKSADVYDKILSNTLPLRVNIVTSTIVESDAV